MVDEDTWMRSSATVSNAPQQEFPRKYNTEGWGQCLVAFRMMYQLRLHRPHQVGDGVLRKTKPRSKFIFTKPFQGLSPGLSRSMTVILAGCGKIISKTSSISSMASIYTVAVWMRSITVTLKLYHVDRQKVPL